MSTKTSKTSKARRYRRISKTKRSTRADAESSTLLPPSDVNVEELLVSLLTYQTNLKLFHFQTPLYSAHKASDWLHAQWIIFLDEFFEVYQGRYGRLHNISANLPLQTVQVTTIPNADIVQRTDTLLSFLESKHAQLEGDDALQMILEDMMHGLLKFKYLLSFK